MLKVVVIAVCISVLLSGSFTFAVCSAQAKVIQRETAKMFTQRKKFEKED